MWDPQTPNVTLCLSCHTVSSERALGFCGPCRGQPHSSSSWGQRVETCRDGSQAILAQVLKMEGQVLNAEPPCFSGFYETLC